MGIFCLYCTSGCDASHKCKRVLHKNIQNVKFLGGALSLSISVYTIYLMLLLMIEFSDKNTKNYIITSHCHNHCCDTIRNYSIYKLQF